MTQYNDPNAISSPWAKWLKGVICLAVVAILAAAFWFRWVPGRPVPAEWARGGASPDNSLSYDVEEDVPSSVAGDVEAVSASNFLFSMGEGGGLHGFDVIQIWANGRCEYTYPDVRPLLDAGSAKAAPTTGSAAPPDSSPFRRATFSVSPQTVADLRRLLVDVDFFNLKRAYRAPPSPAANPAPASARPADGAGSDVSSTPVDNGTQWFVRVHAGSHEKGVWCDNHFPRQIMKINDFIRTEVVEPNTTARGLAAPIDLPRDWVPDLGIPRSGRDEEPTGD
jgi:hypothetical protein